MPWLIKSTPDNPNVPLSNHLFFVHVPRCGGTSLMQHFSIPQKVIESRGLLRGTAMKYFFMRYGELEKANFPIKTKENFVCGILLLASIGLHYVMDDDEDAASLFPTIFGISLVIWLGIIAIFVSLFTTIICTAPVIGRITPIHRWYLWFVHYPLFRLCEAIDWCTGTNKHGYIMHLTAPKLLGYGYVTPQQMDNMCSLAIVRNPYSRMFSIYGYNRFGAQESFPTFCRRWKKLMRHYLNSGEKEEWYTPCHLLPMFEYTHYEGRQLVQSIVKQEELKLLKTREGAEEAIRLDSSVSDLPDLVRDALLGMPHTNSRKTAKKWYDYFDQETMDLTYEMYKMDFEVFGYDTAIKERPDLKPPRLDRRTQLGAMKMTGGSWSRNSLINSSGMRISQANLFGSVKSSMRKEMYRRSSTTALKNSLVQMNKDEILAQVAGLRHISTVGEEESFDETEHHSNDDGRKVYRRSSTSALKRDSDAGSSMSDVDGSVRSKKDE